MYKVLIRPFLFLLKPETAHHFTFNLLRFISSIPGMKGIQRSLFSVKNEHLETDFLGLKLPNKVGLAAGFDKDAKAINSLACYGFGFIEIGTLTPKAQPGNDKPRLFRLKRNKALINRMGFNNDGVENAVTRLSKASPGIIIGGNIGKNKATPNDQAYTDYEICIESLYSVVDYFTVNISSPNTPGLRELQEKEPLSILLSKVRAKVDSIGRKPVLLKIAPDLTDPQLLDIVEIVQKTGIDGIIATNTTISRDNLDYDEKYLEGIGNGGLSGGPLTVRSTEVISFLRNELGPDFPIVGVGGIMSPQDAIDKIKAGADVIQVYTGFIYEGPSFVKKINRAILKEIQQ